MKRATMLLSTALLASLTAGGWMYAENARLRSALASQPGPELKTKAPPAAVSAAQASGSRPAAPPVAGSPPGKKPGGQPAKPDHTATAANPGTGAKFAVTGNPDGTVTICDPETGAQKQMTPQELNQLAQEAQAAAMEHTIKKPGGPSWSPGQAAGAPDTAQHGDYSTAWASQSPDGGKEWLQMKYARPVEVGEINIHESYNPGAVSKVSAILPDGSERVIWQGTATPEQGVIERAVKVPPGIRSDQIRIELDTARVPGWNEIDAVELVGRDGTRQWATESTASSYFGQGRSGYTLGIEPLVEYEGFGVLR